MIAAAVDARGSAVAAARVAAMFEVAQVEARPLLFFEGGALGASTSPLADVSSEPPVVCLGHGEEVRRIELGARPLRGQTAVISATRAGELRLGRGPFGGRALYYVSDGDGLLACSRLGPLAAALGGAVPSMRVEGLGALVASRPEPDAASTHLERVYRVLPCQVLSWSKGTLRRWSVASPTPSPRAGRADDLAVELREGLFAATDRATDRFRSVGVMAGGGLDSSGILAGVARRRARSPAFQFSIVATDFAGDGDDRPHLTAMEDMLGLAPIRVRPREAVAELPRCFVADAAPFTWPTVPTELFMIRRAREAGAEAILTGAGGDVVLEGDIERHFAEVARGGAPLAAILQAAKLKTPWRSSAWRSVRSLVVRGLLVDVLPAGFWRRRRRADVHRSAMWGWAGPGLRAFLDRAPPLVERREDWFGTLAASTELMGVADARAQSEAVTGLPRLDPYLDGALIELIAAFPKESLFHGGRSRGLYVQAMKGVLPESVRVREDKASFEPVTDELLAAGGRDALSSLLTMEALGDLGLVEPGAYRAAFARAARGEEPCGWLDVWPALAVEAYVRGQDSRLAPRHVMPQTR